MRGDGRVEMKLDGENGDKRNSKSLKSMRQLAGRALTNEKRSRKAKEPVWNRPRFKSIKIPKFLFRLLCLASFLFFL